MKIFLLPGQSIRNKEWIEEVESSVKGIFSDTKIQYYKHWTLGEKQTDIPFETEKFVKLINECKEDYIVFAKSIGSLILLNSLKSLKRKPKAVLILGFPYYLVSRLGYDLQGLTEKVNFKIGIYQKEFDTAGTYEEVKTLSNEYVFVNVYECIDEPNDNHRYTNLEYISELLEALIS